MLQQDSTDLVPIELAVQPQTQRERALSHVVQIIHQSLALPIIFKAVTVEVVQLLHVDRAAIFQYCPQEELWRAQAHHSPHQDEPDLATLEISDRANPIATLLKQGEILRIPDSSVYDDAINHSLSQSYPGAWLIIPIVIANQPWGSISMANRQVPYMWHEPEVELVKTIADQLAIAIHQSHLYQQVQQLNRDLEREVSDRTAELQQALNFEESLRHLTNNVLQCLDETEILHAALQESSVVLDAVCGNTIRYCLSFPPGPITLDGTHEQPVRQSANRLASQPLTDTINHPVGHRYLAGYYRTIELASEYMADELDIAGLILSEKQCLELLEQVQTQHICQVCIETPRLSEPWHSLLVCPIIDDHGVVLGAILLFRRRQELFTTAESHFLEQVTKQCAIAIRQSSLYQAAQKQVEELERLHQLKDDFLNTVSHELRTPMSTIHTALERLEQQLALGTVRQLNSDEAMAQWQLIDQWVHLLQDASQREMALIEDLLKLSHLESGTEPFVSSTLHLQIWLPYIVDAFHHQIQRKRQHISIDVADTLPPLTTDFTLLERVVQELLQNAHKYTPMHGWIHVSAKIDDIAPLVMILKVTNSGATIPLEECDRIFDKFYRIPSHDPWRHEGTGLGLALVKRLVEHLYGSIYAISANQTVSMVIRLPLQPSLPPTPENNLFK